MKHRTRIFILTLCIALFSTSALASFQISIQDENSPITEGEALEVDVEILNTGNFDSQDIELRSDSQVRDSQSVALGESSSQVISLKWDTEEGDAGNYFTTVSSEDSSDSFSAEILEKEDDEPFFEVNIENTNSPVTEGEGLEVLYNVENTGSSEGTQEIEFKTDSTVRDSQEVQLSQGEQKQDTLEWSTEVGDANDYFGTVSSEDSSDSESLTVEEKELAECKIDQDSVSISVGESSISPGEQTTVDITVENTGEPQDVGIGLEAGTLSSSEARNVGEGETVSVSFIVSSGNLEEGLNNIESTVSFGAGPCEGETDIVKTDTITLEEAERSLIADFSWDPENPETDEEVSFNDNSRAENTEIERYRWSFHDESTSSVQNPTKTFDEPGVYPVELEIEDSETNSDSVSHSVHVGDARRCDIRTQGFGVSDTSIMEGDEITASVNVINHGVESQEVKLDFIANGKSLGHISRTVENGTQEEFRSEEFSLDSSSEVYAEYSVIGDCDIEGETDRSNVDVEQLVKPFAGFDVSDSSPSRNEVVTFTARQTDDQNIYRWNIDGEGKTGQEVTHPFSETGTKHIELEVENSQGQISTAEKNIEVGRDGPSADFTVSDYNIGLGDEIQFQAEQEGLERYSWDLTEDGNIDATGRETGYLYDSSGFKQVELEVEDRHGNTATGAKTIAVSRDGSGSPEARIDASPEEPVVADTVTLSGSSSTAPLGEIESYEWNPGDGTDERFGEVINHNYERPGTYFPRLRVEDSSGNSAYAVEPLRVRGLENQCNVRVGQLEETPVPGIQDETDYSLEVENNDDETVQANLVLFKDGERFHTDQMRIEEGESGEFEVTVESSESVEIRAEVEIEGDCGVTTFDRSRTMDVDEAELNHPGDGLEIVEVDHPRSICRGDSFTTSVTINNGRADAQTTSLQGSGLGSIVRGPEFDIESGEQLRKSLTFDKVEKIGNNRSFSVSLVSGDGYTGNIDVKDCRGDGDASDITSMEVSPKQIGIGGTVKVSGYLQRNIRTNVDIMLDSETVTTVTSRRDGYYEARIQPTRVGKQQVSAATGSDVKSKTIEVLPTVHMNHLDMPRQVQAGDTFDICGELESQVNAKVVLEREGEPVDSTYSSDEFCFENMEHEYGEYDYEIKASARNSFDSMSRSVEVLDAGPEISNFPDQISSVKSGSGMARVKLYNTGDDTRTYNLRLQDVPRDWLSQTDKTVIVPPNQREEVYFYLTPKASGQFTGQIEVDAEGETIYTEELRLSSRSTHPTKRSWLDRIRMKLPV